MSINWSNLPEGVVTLVAAKYDGERSEVIRSLREVCKPWRADIVVTKATMPQGVELPVLQVLQKTPNLRSLTVAGIQGEVLADIMIVKHLVPDLKIFVFNECDLSRCRMPLSQWIGENTQELTLDSCALNIELFDHMFDFKHLASLYVTFNEYEPEYTNLCIWKAILTHLGSLQSLCIDKMFIFAPCTIFPDLPNLTSLSIIHSTIPNPVFLGSLHSLKYLDLNATEFTEYEGDIVNELPASITTLNICTDVFGISNVESEGFARLATRLPLLSSLHLGNDEEVTDYVLETLASMPSLKRLCFSNCDNVTEAGIMHLARSKLQFLECDETQEGVDALRAAAPAIEIKFGL